MQYYTSIEIKNILQQFQNKTLPKAEWTHEAHLIVAFWYNDEYDFNTALNLVRKGIKSYNISVGTANTDQSGYHETLTVFWMTMTRNFLFTQTNSNLESAINQFITKYAGHNLPAEYYDRETLFSVTARKTWINGNLKKINELFEE